MFNVELLIEQLKSWGKSYIPPSAQITMDEAAKAMTEMNEELKSLRADLDRLKAETNELVADAQKVIKERSPTTKTVSKPRAKKATTK